MVEPLELQNMLGRTPLVEKTVAAQRDDVQQQANAAAQLAAQRQHKNENVQLKRESPRTEVKKDNPKRGQAEKDGKRPAAATTDEPKVELVSADNEEPQHNLDITI
jgi:hypothetical protein